MGKRSNRVYVLLGVLSFIMIISMILDMTVTKTSDKISLEGNIQAEAQENGDNSSGNIIEEAAEVTTEAASRVLSPAQTKAVEEFYKNTVFVGDSIMLGFSTFSSTKEAPQFIKDSIFLAAASYGVDAAINNKGLLYKGESKPLIENLEEIDPDKIFINLGVNELDGVPAEKVAAKYDTLIRNIKEALPDKKIYILGVTYFVEGKETETFNNNGIKAFNNILSSNASKWGVTYLDLGAKLCDDKGYLPKEYSSDGRIHHNNEAYKIWVEFLEDFALEQSNNKR